MPRVLSPALCALSWSPRPNPADVAISALSIVLGILLGTVVSVLRDRQQSLRQELFSEMAVVQACAQQHVKLFRRDKPRLRRSMQLLSAYVDEKRDLLQARKGRRGLLLGGGCS